MTTEEIRFGLSHYGLFTESVLFLLLIAAVHSISVFSFMLSVVGDVPLFVTGVLAIIVLGLAVGYIFVMSQLVSGSFLLVFRVFLYRGLSTRYKLIQVVLASFAGVFFLIGVLSFVLPVPTIVADSTLSNFVVWTMVVVASFEVSVYYFLFKHTVEQ